MKSMIWKRAQSGWPNLLVLLTLIFLPCRRAPPGVRK